MAHDLRNPIMHNNVTQEAYRHLFHLESQFTAAEGYSDNADKVRYRRFAVTIIHKVTKCEEFDAFIPHLAMHYFDRFLSIKELPALEDKANKNLKLLAICCVSLASKMRNKDFSLSEFLKSRKLRINPVRVLEMELELLNGLEWRMQSLTALSFIDFFLHWKDRGPNQGLTRRDMAQIIIESQGDYMVAAFKPSIIAASALLIGSLRVVPPQYDENKSAVLSCPYIDADALSLCAREMHEIMRGQDSGVEAADAGGGSSEAILMNFELNWPSVELERDLDIPDLEKHASLWRLAAEVLAAKLTSCCSV